MCVLFSSASSRLSSYYWPGFLENRLFRLFMIHIILTRYRDIWWTWFGFLHGFNTGLGSVFLCIHSVGIDAIPCSPREGQTQNLWSRFLISDFTHNSLIPRAELSELLSSCLYFTGKRQDTNLYEPLSYEFTCLQAPALGCTPQYLSWTVPSCKCLTWILWCSSSHVTRRLHFFHWGRWQLPLTMQARST